MRKLPHGPGNKAATSKLADVLPGLCRDLALDEKVKELSLLSIWETLVDDLYKKNTRAVSVRKQGGKNILLIRVKEAALASQLTFDIQRLKTELNRFAPQTGVKIDDIRLQVGAIG